MKTIHIKTKVVGDGYEVTEVFRYYSKRYDKWLVIPAGFFSDGATSAPDIHSDAWIIHDHICRYGIWDNGEKITNWQASKVLSDILASEGRWFRRYTWLYATFLFGGGAARKNGMIKL